MATNDVKKHANYSESDYDYLKNKGYTDAEIDQIWNRQNGPCRHDKKAFDMVGYLNA
jgi:hypothetical protein